jgi:alkylation response protein AidB-like acyl-CoA dehydrogenase
MNESSPRQGVSGVGVQSAGCPNDPVSQAPLRQSLAGHLPPEHPLSPRRAYRAFPPLTQGIVCYEPAWIWDQDTAALPPPLAELRRQSRQFADQELRPRALAADLRPHDPATDAAVLRRAAESGVLLGHLPPPLGTGAMALADYPLAWAAAVKVEELCAACGGWGLVLSAHALGMMPLLLSGDKRVWKRFLVPARQRTLAGTPYLFAFAITEPGAGSDVENGYGAAHSRPETIARRAAGGWVLNGRKQYISGGDIADAVTVFAALEGEGLESWTCFLVERGTAGFRWLRNESKMGQRASGAAELELRDVFVPDDHVIGELRSGWALNRASLTCSRLPVAAIALGIARGAMDAAIEFVCQYRLAGKPLIDYQEVQLRVADMIAEASAMRAMIWQLASRPAVTQANAAMSKFRCSDSALRVCEAAMDLLSQHGVLHQNLVEKQFRDARLTPIYEGTNQINRLAVIEDFQEVLLQK